MDRILHTIENVTCTKKIGPICKFTFDKIPDSWFGLDGMICAKSYCQVGDVGKLEYRKNNKSEYLWHFVKLA